MTLGEQLRQLRLEHGMTQEQAAKQLGLTRQAVSSYESGRTQPDLKMLLRLCEVYETDLNTLLHGSQHAQKAAQRVKVASAVLLLLLSFLTLVSSALLWSANHFFPISSGQLTQETRALFESRQHLITVWETLDGVILPLALFGFLLLLVLLLTGKSVVPLKQKFLYGAALAVGILLPALLFAAADPVYSAVDYLITPLLVLGRMVFFVVVSLAAELLRKRKVCQHSSL